MFDVLGDRLALDVTSGAVHSLDPVSADVLSDLVNHGFVRACTIEKHGALHTEEALAEIDALSDAGLLFGAPPPYPPQQATPIVKSLCMNIAHDCNLRCDYCFARTGDYGKSRGLMSAEVARQAVDFLISQSGGRATCEMDFFGGEPLLNMAVVKEVVRYAERAGEMAGKHFRFTLTTNATLMDKDTLEFLNSKNMQVILSIDGRQQVHDRFRCYPDGRGSHASALENTITFLRSRDYQNYYVRGTYTRENLDFTEDARWFIEHGIKSFSLEPAAIDPTLSYAITADDLPRVFLEYERLVSLYLSQRRAGTPFSFYHFEVDLSGGPCLEKRMSGCGAGREYLAVSADGTLYPCHQFDGMAEFQMGTVFKPDLAPVRERLTRAGLQYKLKCAGCWARFYCGGGCHAQALLRNGSLHEPDAVACEIQKKRLECAIYAEAQRR